MDLSIVTTTKKNPYIIRRYLININKDKIFHLTCLCDHLPEVWELEYYTYSKWLCNTSIKVRKLIPTTFIFNCNFLLTDLTLLTFKRNESAQLSH